MGRVPKHTGKRTSFVVAWVIEISMMLDMWEDTQALNFSASISCSGNNGNRGRVESERENSVFDENDSVTNLVEDN